MMIDRKRSMFRGICGATLVLAILGADAVSAKVKIEHDPIAKSKSGRRIEIEAGIKDKQAGVKDARVYFKSGYDSRFWFAPMRVSGNKYLGILPAPALGADTVEYRIYAVNGSGQFVKTQLYTIKIDDDEEALARLQHKQPTDVELDLDQIEQVRDLARRGGEPDPSTRVEVRNDVPGSVNPSQIPGFHDYIVMANAAPAAAGAGLGAATAIKAGGAGLGKGAVLGTLAGLGGVAAAIAATSSSDDSGGSGQAVTLANSGVDNIHICIDCSGRDFNDNNFLRPGQSRTVTVAIPSGQQSVDTRFVSGRDDRVLATRTCTVSRNTRLTVRYTETSFGRNAALRCE